MSVRVAVLISGRGSNLQALLDAKQDAYEIALVVSKRYGVQLRADSQENQSIFASLRHLCGYIAAHRTK